MESKFKTWLQQNGAEILPVTNEFEEIRFKGSEIGVRYKSGKYSNEYARNAYYCYSNGHKWEGRPVSFGTQPHYKKEKKAILKRDGTACFYCGELLGDDITVEHLISLVSGGSNTLGNMVLAHESCNNSAGNKHVVEKIGLALKLRFE